MTAAADLFDLMRELVAALIAYVRWHPAVGLAAVIVLAVLLFLLDRLAKER